jgi:hypothetical protein
MHKAAASGTLTDSMRMLLMGMDGGNPSAFLRRRVSLSFADGVSTREEDEFEPSAALFTIPLRNRPVDAAAANMTVPPL